ncbi:MAG: response regulator, partial [Dokdonella sp.]
DNVLTLQFLRSALEASGHRCTTAVSGDMALACVEGADRFDLLLIDARMPGCSGVQTLGRIRAGTSPSRTTPALATTAADRTTHAPLREAGFVGVVSKPIGLDELAKVISRHVYADVVVGSFAGSESALLLDERAALRCAGNDQGIVAALRRLFAEELEALPGECARLCEQNNVEGLRDRLHRLAASAGFCGAVALSNSVAVTEAALAKSGSAADCPQLRCSLELAASTRSALDEI